MKIYFILLSLISLNIYAKAIPGQGISAQKFNSSAAQIGEIKKSLLSESQFMSLYGNCWKLVNSVPLANTDLGVATNASSIPSLIAEGLFLRQAKPGRNLISTESDDYKAHSHTLRISNGAGGDPNSMVARNGGTGGNGGISSGSSSYVNTGSNVGGETRPKNIAVNMFVKVNHQCPYN